MATGRPSAKEGSDFVAIAANGHGTPPASVCTGVIVEEKAAGRVGAAANRSVEALDEKFGGRTGEGGEQPVQAAFPGNELERPGTFLGDELVVTFGDAENFVDWLDPGRRKGLIGDNGSKDGAKRFAETQDAEQDRVDGLRFRWSRSGRRRAARSWETKLASTRKETNSSQERS